MLSGIGETTLDRRLAAILAIDVVGYSRLMGADEEGTLTNLHQSRALIDETVTTHDGRTFGVAGDSVIAEFPSPVKAIQAAIEIQSGVAKLNADRPDNRKMQLRIGANLGDVVVDGDALFGEGVNVAARMEQQAPPGGIILSRAIRDQIRDRLDITLADLGEISVKNIARPVRIFQVLRDGEVPIEIPHPKRRLWTAVFAVAILIATSAAWFYSRPTGISPDGKIAALADGSQSILVLPLDNLSGDPAQDYFANGLSDDITTDLSQLSGLFVIARNTAFHYADKGLDPRQISQELGVKYVLGGSVRRSGDKLRINVQLVDGKSGTHLWADRYDGALDDVLTFQDKIIESIIASLPLHLDVAQRKRSKAAETDNPQAFDAFLQGWEQYIKKTPEGFAAALPHYKRAIELDPNYGRAYAALAALYWDAYLTYRHDELDVGYNLQALVEAENYLEKALETPTALAHQVASGMRRADNQHDEMMQEANTAVRLDPNDPESYLKLAFALMMNGEPSDGLLAIDKAMTLNPHYPPDYLALKGAAYYTMKDYGTALKYLERSYERNPQGTLSVMFLIATYARLGRADDAERVVADYPSALSVHWTGGHFNFRNHEDWAHLQEALLKGGMPN